MATKREFVPAIWSINERRMLSQIKAYYVKALKEAEDKLIEIMSGQILAVDNAGGGGHGAPEWKAGLIKAVRTIYRDVADNYIEIGVGIPEKGYTDRLTIEAMIYEAGVGSESDAGTPPVQTRPGETVWKTNMSRGISTAMSSYYIPQFNQYGAHYVENSIKLMAKYFDDVLDSATANMPDSIIYGNITSKKGSR